MNLLRPGVHIIIFLIQLSLATEGCKKVEGNKPTFLQVSSVTSVTKTSAVVRNEIPFEGSFPVTECGVCWSITENPTINDTKTSDGNGREKFTSTVSGLTPNTLFYLRPYATNKAGTGYGYQICIKTKAGEVTDIDGNKYSTIKAGNFEWIAENLKATKLNDGTDIPLVTDNTEWSNLSSPAYCWFNNTGLISGNTYGALYNWYAVNTGKLCPAGWHVATLDEWYSLVYQFDNNLQVDMESETAGCALVKPDSALFTGCILNALNKSGLSAIAGGGRYYNGEFYRDGKSSRFWLPEDLYPGSSFAFIMYVSCSCTTKQVDMSTGDRSFGYSVRCVKD